MPNFLISHRLYERRQRASGVHHTMRHVMHQLRQISSTQSRPPHEVLNSMTIFSPSAPFMSHGQVVGTFSGSGSGPGSWDNGHLFVLDLARHLFISQKPRFILFIMPSLGPGPTRATGDPGADLRSLRWPETAERFNTDMLNMMALKAASPPSEQALGGRVRCHIRGSKLNHSE